MRRPIALAALALLAALPAAAHASATLPVPATAMLVQLRAGAACTQATFLHGNGARLVSGALRLWSVPGSRTSDVLPTLRRAGAVAFAEPERTYRAAAVTTTRAATDYADPLVGSEWWRTVIGVVDLTPPGPGVPVTIVDSGVDLAHEEFAARPNLVPVNTQEPANIGGRHGTMVASVIGAPVNGIGLVGIYPDAIVRTYDAAIGDGTTLATSEIVEGILSASQIGKGVVNLSLGGSSKSLSIEQAVYLAIQRGSLVVAASGNAGDEGNPLEYPAAVPHVLTVAATDRADAPAPFSSRSGFVDISAPGVEINVARPASLGGPYSVESGTSFAAPLVSGAAAWLWTLRPELDASQVAEILRRSARDLGAPGWDIATGYGMLNVPAALALAPPAKDTPEPNDDIGYVDPDSVDFANFPPLTTQVRTAASAAGRLMRFDDPRDVYRLWLPRNRTVTVTVTSDKPVTLGLYKQGASQTVLGPGGVSDRLVFLKPTASGTLTYRTGTSGRIAFLAVGMPNGGGRDIAYTVAVKATK